MHLQRLTANARIGITRMRLHCRVRKGAIAKLEIEERYGIFRQLLTPTPDPVTHFTDNISVIGITLFESMRYANASGPSIEAKGK